MSSFTLPPYDKLNLNETLGMRNSWGVFGEDDELGTVNLVTPEAIRRGAAEVLTGRIFNLSLPLDLPNPRWSAQRKQYSHRIFSPRRNSQDDYVDGFYLQGSSQWDGLRHIAAREFGFYNGTAAEDAGPDGSRLGIEKWAAHGLMSRGLLIDVASYLEAEGRPLDPRKAESIPAHVLAEVLESQGCQPEPGDILLVRTGYVGAYKAASPEERADFVSLRDSAGLAADEDMARYLWNLHVAAVAADNPAVEVVPGSPQVGSLHRRLIPMLGLAIGEWFDLEELASDCRRDGRYTCLLAAVPLNLPGGVGSPANAVAVK